MTAIRESRTHETTGHAASPTSRDDDRSLGDFANDLAAISLSSDEIPALDSATIACVEIDDYDRTAQRTGPLL